MFRAASLLFLGARQAIASQAIASHTYLDLPDLPEPLFLHTATATPAGVVVFGGLTLGQPGVRVSQATFVLDFAKAPLEWATVPLTASSFSLSSSIVPQARSY